MSTRDGLLFTAGWCAYGTATAWIEGQAGWMWLLALCTVLDLALAWAMGSVARASRSTGGRP